MARRSNGIGIEPTIYTGTMTQQNILGNRRAALLAHFLSTEKGLGMKQLSVTIAARGNTTKKNVSQSVCHKKLSDRYYVLGE